jgi:hypothetical protein
MKEQTKGLINEADDEHDEQEKFNDSELIFQVSD